MRVVLTISAFVFVLISCKSEPPLLKSEDASDLEKEYFEDYEQPEGFWGYINRKNELIIKDIYDDTRDFSEGLALANFEGRWGYIDLDGNTLIKHEFLQGNRFSEGRAIVRDFERNYSIIDKTGKVLLKTQDQQIKDFTNGVALFKKDFLWGAYNLEGEELIPNEYEKLTVIDENYLIAKSNKKYGIIDHSGKVVLPFQYDRIKSSNGFPFIVKKGKEEWIIDQSFKPASSKYEKIYDFDGELSVAKLGSYILINRKGEKFKDLEFEQVEPVGEGKFKYKQEGKWGLLDEDGEKLTSALYTFMNKYKEDRLVIGFADNAWTYLDEKGVPIVDIRFPLIWDFHNGLARFLSQDGVGFINKKGELVISPQYFEVRDFHEDLARVQIFR